MGSKFSRRLLYERRTYGHWQLFPALLEILEFIYRHKELRSDFAVATGRRKFAHEARMNLYSSATLWRDDRECVNGLPNYRRIPPQ